MPKFNVNVTFDLVTTVVPDGIAALTDTSAICIPATTVDGTAENVSVVPPAAVAALAVKVTARAETASGFVTAIGIFSRSAPRQRDAC